MKTLLLVLATVVVLALSTATQLHATGGYRNKYGGGGGYHGGGGANRYANPYPYGSPIDLMLRSQRVLVHAAIYPQELPWVLQYATLAVKDGGRFRWVPKVYRPKVSLAHSVYGSHSLTHFIVLLPLTRTLDTLVSTSGRPCSAANSYARCA